MKKSVAYKRLRDADNHFIGFKRTIVEYLPAGSNEWQLEPLDYKEGEKLATPPSNIVSMKRARMQ